MSPSPKRHRCPLPLHPHRLLCPLTYVTFGPPPFSSPLSPSSFIHPSIRQLQGVFTLPDALPYLWPSFAFFHDKRSIFSNQESTPFVLALNHPVGGTYMTSRGRVGINRQQRLNTHHRTSADYLSLKNPVLCAILGRSVHTFA